MNPEIILPPYVAVFSEWLKGQPVFAGLLLLMLLDIMVGICLSLIRKTLSSAVSWRGMSRKIIMLLLVGTSAVLQQFIPSFPFLNVVSAFYTLTEAISILENAAMAGVPLPKGLVETLMKLREQQKIMSDQKLPQQIQQQPQSNTTVVVVPGVAPVKDLVTEIIHKP